MARTQDLRQGKSYPRGPSTLAGATALNYTERHHRGSPDPGRQDTPPSGAESPEPSLGQHPVDKPEAPPSVESPHEETLERKSSGLKQ